MMKNLALVTRITLLTLSLGFVSYTFAQDNVRQSLNEVSTPSMQQEIQSPLSILQHEWAHINYELEDKQKEKAFATLMEKAKFFVSKEPNTNTPALIVFTSL